MKLPGELLRTVVAGPASIEAIVRYCAKIALAIDSGRSNEKEIAAAILRDFGLKEK